MTDFDLLRLIGEAEDRYIMDSRKKPRKRRTPWRSYALAACAVLAVLLGGAGIWRYVAMQSGSTEGSSAAEETLLETQADGSETLEEAPAAAEPDTAGTEVPEAGTDYDVTLLAGAEYPEAIGLEDFEAASERWTENQTTEETKSALNAFAYSTASKLLQGSGESGCYSPLSLYQALAILTSGAQGQTREELLSLLGMQDAETLAEESGKLYRGNYRENEAETLKIANSLWLDETGSDGTPISYNQDWVLSAAANYYASVYEAEFNNEDTALALGQWIADNTGGLLHPDPETLDFEDDTVMAIVNTVWYEAGWIDTFSQDENTTEDFTTGDGETVSWEFMHRAEESGRYVKGENYTKSYLSLTTGRMIIVLPDEGVDVDDLLGEEALWECFENGDYQYADVRWSVPKFTTDATYDLTEMLISLGVVSAFDEDSADFSLISDTPLVVSQVQQGTHIAIDEEGVEAAAYTLTMAAETADLEPEDLEIIEMNLNRPFIYLITTNDGSTLFLGVVRDPEG